MDVPYDRIICASNDNKVLHDFFETGIYDLRKRPLTKTISPAIDILVSSNLERLLWMHLGMKRVFSDIGTYCPVQLPGQNIFCPGQKFCPWLQTKSKNDF